MTPRTLRLTRLAFLGFLLLYGVASLRAPAEWRLLDGVNLAIHETGHLVFAPFGEFLAYLGGTLLQLLFPAAFVVYFARRRERFAAAVALWWVAQNCWNVSVYIADARRQALPLVGGVEHDWAYLLGGVGWLAHDAALARAVHAVGVLLFAWALVNGFRAAMAGSPPPAALPSVLPPADSKIAQS